MLGTKGPAGVVGDHVRRVSSRTLRDLEPLRQQPSAAVCPSLSKEGSSILMLISAASKHERLLEESPLGESLARRRSRGARRIGLLRRGHSPAMARQHFPLRKGELT